MDLYLAGAEHPTYLKKLVDLGVTHIAISYYEWSRRHSSDHLFKFIPAELSVCVTAGVARKESIDWDDFSESYIEFCERNADEALIYDMDAPLCPLPVRKRTREKLSVLPNVVVFPLEGENLASVATLHERVGINARLAKSTPAQELRRIQGLLYGSNVTDPKVLKLARFTATTSFAWMGGKRYGELWVFARNKLSHYSAGNLAKAVRVHDRDIEALGVDPARCAANDSDALTAIAVRSLQAMAQSLSKRRRDQMPEVANTLDKNGDGEVDATTMVPTDILAQVNGAEPLIGRERVHLPIISTDLQHETTLVMSVDGSLRQCNSCYLSTVCPLYAADNACGYDLPVQLETVEQREAASQTLLELQFKRVAFGAYAEEIEGAGLTARVGQEMDRFFKIQESMKEINTPINAGGVMERFFGNVPGLGSGNGQTSEVNSEEDEEESSETFDAEVIEEEYRASENSIARAASA